MKTNDIEQVAINNDVLSWTSEGGKYILHITGQDGKNKVSKFVTVTENSYDLSLLKLNGDNNAEYQITIQVAGDSEKLAITSDYNKDNVLTQILGVRKDTNEHVLLLYGVGAY